MTRYPKAPSSFLTSIISSRYLSVWIAIGLLIVIALLIALETLTRTSFTTVLPLTSFLALTALGQMLVVMTGGDRLIRAQFPKTQPVDFGEANGVVAMAAAFGQLYAATNDNKLWRREAFSQDVSWDLIGHANNVVAIGAIGGIPIGANYLGGWLVVLFSSNMA